MLLADFIDTNNNNSFNKLQPFNKYDKKFSHNCLKIHENPNINE